MTDLLNPQDVIIILVVGIITTIGIMTVSNMDETPITASLISGLSSTFKYFLIALSISGGIVFIIWITKIFCFPIL